VVENTASGPVLQLSDPVPLEMFTMRGLVERRSGGELPRDLPADALVGPGDQRRGRVVNRLVAAG
jgi:hypothetical protein